MNMHEFNFKRPKSNRSCHFIKIIDRISTIKQPLVYYEGYTLTNKNLDVEFFSSYTKRGEEFMEIHFPGEEW